MNTASMIIEFSRYFFDGKFNKINCWREDFNNEYWYCGIRKDFRVLDIGIEEYRLEKMKKYYFITKLNLDSIIKITTLYKKIQKRNLIERDY